MKSITIVVPVFNEEESLPRLLAELSRVTLDVEKLGLSCGVLFSDNNSTDNSWELIKGWLTVNPKSKGIRLRRNYGYQASLLTAFSHASSNAIIVYQSDMQDPVDLIPEMVRFWMGGISTVAGQAIARGEGLLNKTTRFIFYKMLNLVSEHKHPAGVQDFYLLDESVYKDFIDSPTQFQFIRSRVSQDFQFQKLIPYTRKIRENGATKFNFADKLNLAIDGLLGNSVRFRHLLVFTSAAIGLLTLCSAFVVTTLYLFGWRTIKGWVPIVLLELLVASAGLFAFSVMFELLARLYQLEVKPIKVKVSAMFGDTKYL